VGTNDEISAVNACQPRAHALTPKLPLQPGNIAGAGTQCYGSVCVSRLYRLAARLLRLALTITRKGWVENSHLAFLFVLRPLLSFLCLETSCTNCCVMWGVVFSRCTKFEERFLLAGSIGRAPVLFVIRTLWKNATPWKFV
jgi:hypothetical protein